MKRDILYLLVVVVLLGVAAATWFMWQSKAKSNVPPPMMVTVEATTTLEDPTGLSIYTNGEFGFSLRYPSNDTVENTFSSSRLAANWRANAPPSATGTPIVAIVAYRVESDHSYPRYFEAEVRIGASKDPNEVRNCLKPTTTRGETTAPDKTIGGIKFKTFTFQNAATMQYEKGVSYRALHDGYCYAIEKLQTGSSYHGDPPNKDDSTDATLQSKYDSLASVIDGFSFARP